MAGKAKEESAEKAKLEADKAAEDAAKADAEVATKQTLYDKLKKEPKERETQLKELEGLVDQATKTEAQGDYVGLYFLVGEAKSLEQEIKIPPVEDYTAQLRDAQSALDTAKQAAAGAKAKSNEMLEAYNKAQKANLDAKTSRRGDLLSALKSVESTPIASSS